MRAAVSFVLFGAGAVIGVTSFLLALLWWRTADVVRALRSN
jgi:hypothetical protein